MTIEKGQPWGTACQVPSDRIIARNDAELALCSPDHMVSLSGGDIWKSLGSPAVPQQGTEATLVHIDAIEVDIDSQKKFLIASSIEIGSLIGRNRYLCIANASFVSEKNIAPRAHPNDGFLDLLEIDNAMPWRQRWSASRRAQTGVHIPHPHISSRRVRELRIDRETQTERLTVDGVRIKDWHTVVIQVIPDYWQVVL